MYAVKLAYPISKSPKNEVVAECRINHIVNTSKLKYVFRLVESVSQVIGQNSLAPLSANKTH